MVNNPGRKTSKQKRLDAWNQKLVASKGVVPGGRDDASWLSVIFISWMNPLVRLAYDRSLEMKNLFPIPDKSKPESLLKNFDEAWGEQMKLPKGKRSLGTALWKCFKPAVILSGWMFGGMYISLVAVPLIIQRILLWVSTQDNGKEQGQGLGRGILFASLLFLVGFFGSGLLSHHALIILFKLGMEVRSTINGATFAKSLRLSNKARQQTTVGAMVTLMSNDAQRLPDAVPLCHGIWSAPTFIIVLIAIIIRTIGIAALAGIAFLVLMIPVQMFMVKQQIGVQRAQVQQTQSRIKVVNDVLQGIRIVKYYAWEASFMNRIESLRNLELLKVKHFAILQAYNMMFMRTTPYIMVMLTLITYYNMTGEFEPDVVFTAASLLLVLSMPLMMLPMTLAGFAQAKNFLELDEICEDDRVWTNRDGNGKGYGSVSITGKFVWTPDDEENEEEASCKDDGGEGAGDEDNEESEDAKQEKWELNVDNLDVPAGKLVSVIGQVASGKSSLVSAVLGEMTKVEGTVTVDGSMAYVAQTAWIINASVKENILMGRAYDHARYRKVLRVCDLHQDLAALPAGDETEIGEKGINLSGGQKQRISLARAAYANADVYILDDPLSAVDARVGRHLFENCLAGLLKGKTIILCTNQLQFLSRADLVVFIQGGRITRRGSYFDLMAADDETLHRFLETFNKDEHKPEEASKQEADKGKDEECSRRPHLRSDEGGKPSSVASPIIPSRGSRSRSGSRIRSRSGSRIRSRSGSRSRSRSRPYTPSSIGSAFEWRRAARIASDASAGLVEGNFLGEGAMTQIDSELEERVLSNVDDRQLIRSISLAGDTDDAESLVRLQSDASAYKNVGANTLQRGRASSARGQVGSSAGRSVTSTGVSELSKAGAVGSAGVLQTVEGQAEGSVKWKIFRTYFRDGSGGWTLPMVLLVLVVLTQATSNAFEYWLSYWSDAYLNATLEGKEEPPSWYQFIYIGLCVFTVGMYLLRGFLFASQAVMSSRYMHAVLLRGVVRAPVSFFDVTPLGRVLNRFTKDIDAMDLLLPKSMPQFVSLLAIITGNIVTVIVVLPWFAVVVVPVIFGFMLVQERYRPISRDLQRLESMSRSPVVALYSETLNGVSTLRAYNQQEQFIERNNHMLTGSASTFYHMHSANRWLGLRLDAMGSLMNFSAAMIIVMLTYTDSPFISTGVAGLVLLYTQQFTQNMNWLVRMGCETEARITSVERAKEYAELKPEADLIVDNNRPPTGWPGTGALQMTGVEMRYRPELDLVLKGVTLDVKGGERVGIAGRTGSGKSSLMVTLFRMVEPCGGTITIDGVNATQIGLQDLREALSIIPQDPVMFCGTMRQNLDPFGRHSDAAIWAALEAVMLGPYISGLQEKLESEVSEGGSNLSLGQRQLLCLARAVLRRNKILVMDEATANVDLETDGMIQRAIREEFSGCTVLTIAHRLETIMDSDKILVMEDGKVGEFDTPANLVAREKSLLMGFIRQTGSESARRLVSIANGSMRSGCSIAVPENLAESSSVDEAGIVELAMSGNDGDDAMTSDGFEEDGDNGASSPSPPTTGMSDPDSSMGGDRETARVT